MKALLMRMSFNVSKRVRRDKAPKEQKSTRIDSNNNPRLRTFHTPSWHFETLDLDGPWCPKNTLPPNVFWLDVLPKLRDFEGMNWAQIESTGSHEVSIRKIIPDAQRRLRGIGQADTHSIFSLRLTGTQRIWGIRFGSILKMLWWDPEHQICPSQRK